MSGAAGAEPNNVIAGRYEIRDVLGEGDRKRTYLARDTKMDRLVAISFVKPDAILADPEGTEREAKVLGRIGSHDNIVSLYDYEVAVDGTIHYMVFEYLDGGTLAAYLREGDPRSLDEALRIGRQLCRGLAHLHGRSIIHRDVSPQNVWLDDRRVAHLGDFDSAIPFGSTVDLRPITTNSFAAPEERESGPLDERSDLYSLGAVLYAVATGGRRPDEIGIWQARPDFPSAFGDLVGELLSESPDDRPSDAETVLERLNEIRHISNVERSDRRGRSRQHRAQVVPPPPARATPAGFAQSGGAGEVAARTAAERAAEAAQQGGYEDHCRVPEHSGGTLLVGVDDAGVVLGIEPDFEYCQKGKHNPDGWMLSLETVIIYALGADVWGAIRVSLVRHEEHMVAVVVCPRRPSQTWHFEDGSERFYIRGANATEDLSGRSLVGYIRERWPGVIPSGYRRRPAKISLPTLHMGPCIARW